MFVIFRLILSVVMFAVLLGGVYSAYKHFSGLDPFKLDPQSVVLGIMSQNKDISEVINKIPGFKGKLDTIPRLLPVQKEGKLLTSKPIFTFLLVADSHNDNINLKKALIQAKDKDPKFIIGLGDYTEVGTLEEMKNAKKEFDATGLRYFLTPGDHDLWDCRNRSFSPICNFEQVFGPPYQAFGFDDFRFLILFNSDNYVGIDQNQMDWLLSEMERAKKEGVKAVYVFLHEPLYHPSSDHIMGRVEQSLKSQAKSLIYEFKDAGVKKVFAGDTHYFSEYEEPVTKLSMVTVGAVTIERNPQAPRYAVVWVFEDGNIKVEDVEIK